MDPETKNLYTSKNAHFVLEMLKPIELSRRSVSAKGMLWLLNTTSPKILQHPLNNIIIAFFPFRLLWLIFGYNWRSACEPLSKGEFDRLDGPHHGGELNQNF